MAAGGYAIARFGLRASMLTGAVGGPLSNLLFVWLATRGHDIGALFLAITLDNVFSGFAGTCLIVYMSSLTAKGFTATQYALFSSLYALPGKILEGTSGFVVDAVGYDTFFVYTASLSLVGLTLLFVLAKRGVFYKSSGDGHSE